MQFIPTVVLIYLFSMPIVGSELLNSVSFNGSASSSNSPIESLTSTTYEDLTTSSQELTSLLAPGQESSSLEYENCRNEGVCTFVCDSGAAETLFADLTPLYNQHLECLACGITVQITSGVIFPKNRISNFWRLGNIELRRFDLNLKGVVEIEPQAFSDQAFRTVETLVLRELQMMTVFHNATLSGFVSLRFLKLIELVAYEFKPESLSAIAATLSYLIIDGQNKSMTSVNIDGLTGSTALSSVKLFKIQANLSDTLSSESFGGLVRIRVLVLSDCEIQVIAPDTFTPIELTLEKLYLERNKLKTIHQDFFTIVSQTQRELFIYLSGNPWHCDSDLSAYRWFLDNYSWAFHGDDSICASPEPLRNVLVRDADVYTATAYPSITVEPLPTTNAAVIEPQCPGSSLPTDQESVQIQGQTLSITLSHKENGLLFITKHNIVSNPKLVWFQSNSPSVFTDQNAIFELNCMTLISSESMIPNLTFDTVYTFCLMDQNDGVLLSPFNCGSYYHSTTHINEIWIAKENLGWVIAGTVCGFLLSIVSGVLLGFVILRQNPNWVTTNGSEIDDIKLRTRRSVHSNQYTGEHADNRISNTWIAEVPATSASEVNACEMNAAKHLLTRPKYPDYVDSHNCPEKMLYVSSVPVRKEMENVEQTIDGRNTDNLENYYSTLEETDIQRNSSK